MLNNKIIIIRSNSIDTFGDVNGNILHYAYLMKYIKERGLMNQTDNCNLKKVVYSLIMNNEIVLLNVVNGEKNHGLLFLPHDFSEYQLRKLLELAFYFNDYILNISYNLSMNKDDLLGLEKNYQATGNLKMVLLDLFFEIENLKENYDLKRK